MQTSLQPDDDLLKDLERIRFVSRNFENLQGFWAAWFGLMALISVLVGLLMTQLAGVKPAWEREFDWAFYLILFWFSGIILGSYFVLTRLGDNYRKRYVVVQTKNPLTWLNLVMLTYGITGFSHLHSGQRAYVVIGLSWFVVGLCRPQMDRLALGLGILALGAFKDFLPPMVGSLDTSFFLCGAVNLIAGLLDHRLLVRTLGSAQAPSAEHKAAATAEVARP
jgi:hypothetical protein